MAQPSEVESYMKRSVTKDLILEYNQALASILNT